MVRKITTVIDFPKLCGPDCVPVVVPKNYKPDLSFVSAFERTLLSRLLEGLIFCLHVSE